MKAAQKTGKILNFRVSAFSRAIFVSGMLNGTRLYIACHSEERSDEESPTREGNLCPEGTLRFAQSDMKSERLVYSSMQSSFLNETRKLRSKIKIMSKRVQ